MFSCVNKMFLTIRWIQLKTIHEGTSSGFYILGPYHLKLSTKTDGFPDYKSQLTHVQSF